MSGKTVLMQRLGLEHPIIQAPLAGGGDTPELVAAVCNAGALGFIGAAYLTPQQIAETGRAVRARTPRPFGINLFAPLPPASSAKNPDAALRRVAPYFAELGLPAPSLPAALQTDASVFSFTFGILPADAIQAIKGRQMFLMGTATTVDEAVALEKAGVDAVVTQGSEAGGHRGTFAGDFAAGMVGTISLVPQVVDAVRIPVVASGGIMDGRGIAAALALGANAVQLGTAFLTCDESGVPNAYKEALLHAREDQTRITRAFSGRPARYRESLYDRSGIQRCPRCDSRVSAAERSDSPTPLRSRQTGSRRVPLAVGRPRCPPSPPPIRSGPHRQARTRNRIHHRSLMNRLII